LADFDLVGQALVLRVLEVVTEEADELGEAGPVEAVGAAEIEDDLVSGGGGAGTADAFDDLEVFDRRGVFSGDGDLFDKHGLRYTILK
jgi:hypothetical protein